MLKCEARMKFYAHKDFREIAILIAKYFSCKIPKYAYPIFKTQELQADVLKTLSIFNIPVWPLQFTENTAIFKILHF